jgi:hypothetical protein
MIFSIYRRNYPDKQIKTRKNPTMKITVFQSHKLLAARTTKTKNSLSLMENFRLVLQMIMKKFVCWFFFYHIHFTFYFHFILQDHQF